MSDVKTAPTGFNLMQDKHSCANCTSSDAQSEPSLLCYLNPTIRLLRYSKLFNARIGRSYEIEMVQDDPKAMGELERDEDFIVT